MTLIVKSDFQFKFYKETEAVAVAITRIPGGSMKDRINVDPKTRIVEIVIVYKRTFESNR
jgi:hypothetical protein